MSEQSTHNSYESCIPFIQSNKVKSIYSSSTVFCIRKTEGVKQLILFNVETIDYQYLIIFLIIVVRK